jgi:secondary thiamine-phosphate synthase enzyme
MPVTLEKLTVSTHRIGEFVEITHQIAGAVERAGVREGIALVRSRHTTAAITCNEPDPRLHEDMCDAVYATFPASRHYRHIEEGAENAIAHLATSMLFGEATWLPIRNGHLDLGTWQHVYGHVPSSGVNRRHHPHSESRVLHGDG